MKRTLALWMTLLGAFWLTRAVISACAFERVADRGVRAFVLLLVVPLLQAVVVAWLTRPVRSP